MHLNLFSNLNKNISFPRVESEIIIQPNNLNPQGTAHGGDLMKIMDTVAGMTARKHSKGMVVTARLDEVEFHKPLVIGDQVTVIGQLIHVGTSSMEILVQMYAHDLNDYNNPVLASSSFVTMIHLVDWKPSEVPKLLAETEEEKILFKFGEEKHNQIREKIKR